MYFFGTIPWSCGVIVLWYAALVRSPRGEEFSASRPIWDRCQPNILPNLVATVCGQQQVRSRGFKWAITLGELFLKSLYFLHLPLISLSLLPHRIGTAAIKLLQSLLSPAIFLNSVTPVPIFAISSVPSTCFLDTSLIVLPLTATASYYLPSVRCIKLF